MNLVTRSRTLVWIQSVPSMYLPMWSLNKKLSYSIHDILCRPPNANRFPLPLDLITLTPEKTKAEPFEVRCAHEMSI